MRTHQKSALRFCIPLLGLGLASSAVAEGLRNAPPGAFGNGRPGAKLAHVDDASAISINPANLLDLKTGEFQVSPSFVYIDRNTRADNGLRASTTEEFKVLGEVYYTQPAGEGNFAWGVGLTVPYGQSVVYDEDFDFRGQTPYFTENVFIDIKPTVAYRVNARISVGGGLDLIWSELTFKQHYPWSLLTGRATDPDGRMTFNGDGFTIGANAAINLEVTENQRASLVVKAPFTVKYEGDFKNGNIPAEAAALGATERSDFETEVEYPTIVAFGYGVQVTEDIRVGADVEWLEWSNFDELPINVGNNGVLFPAPAIPENWNDTFTAGVGGDWVINDHWTVRGGYWFAETPVNPKYQQPNIPESDLHIFSAGVKRSYENHSIDVSWLGINYEGTDIDNNINPAFNGSYNSKTHIVTVSYNRPF